jgi:hypothetical protein
VIISFNQPAFIPWGGFFTRLMASDRMVLLDDTLFARGFTFVNRNRLKGPGGEVRVTVPIKKSNRGRQKIHELKINEKKFWWRKFRATLEHTYGKSANFPVWDKYFSEIIGVEGDSFLEMAQQILEAMRIELRIKSTFIRQTESGIQGQGEALLIKLARHLEAREVLLPYPAKRVIDWNAIQRQGIKIQFLKYIPTVYPQFWGKFLSNLSVLDLILCTGAEAGLLLKGCYSLTSP